jgi:hypothetical protein
MADSFAMERFKARLVPPAPARAAPPVRRTSPLEDHEVALLMRAVTMDEIRSAARALGLTFSTAYRERARLYATRPMYEWSEIIRRGRPAT